MNTVAALGPNAVCDEQRSDELDRFRRITDAHGHQAGVADDEHQDPI